MSDIQEVLVSQGHYMRWIPKMYQGIVMRPYELQDFEPLLKIMQKLGYGTAVQVQGFSVSRCVYGGAQWVISKLLVTHGYSLDILDFA